MVYKGFDTLIVEWLNQPIKHTRYLTYLIFCCDNTKNLLFQ